MTKDHINPDHYRQYPVEAIEIIERMSSPLMANVVKYVWRLGYKDDKEQDRQKALWYLDRFYERKSYISQSLIQYNGIRRNYLNKLEGHMPAELLRIIDTVIHESCFRIIPNETHIRLREAIEAL